MYRWGAAAAILQWSWCDSAASTHAQGHQPDIKRSHEPNTLTDDDDGDDGGDGDGDGKGASRPEPPFARDGRRGGGCWPSSYRAYCDENKQQLLPPKPASLTLASIPSRQEQLAALKTIEECDVLVIGGGATGAGIALDAASRGLKAVLVEREDFGSRTSSRSTKLLHGRVR